jgi:cellulose synthase/poly-beta-1,6-N-acetylglucosamine synthase-like glycosyltransferase/peptidoglycan/xylan/chitin deacetylase (PgdA/CDA1 family)/spore germination protein YaaH
MTIDAPIFYDASGRRDRWSVRAFLALVIAVVIASALFAATVIEVPVPRPLAIAMEHPLPRPLKQQVSRLRHRLTSWLPSGPTARPNDPIAVGFYVPWDDASRGSLARHIGQLDWVVPSLYAVNGPRHQFTITPDPNFGAILATTSHKPKVLPMVQNAVEDNWDGAGAAGLLRNPRARERLLDQLGQALDARKADGVVFDFEALPASAQGDYRRFLAEARARFAKQGRLVIATVPVEDPAWNLGAYAAVTDRLVLMAYDQHYPGGEAGPIASQPWFVAQLNAALRQIPAGRAIVAVGNYAYDWTSAGHGQGLSIEEAWLEAHDSAAPINFDADSGNPTFRYEDKGEAHTVWMLDAATAWNQIRAARLKGVGGIALWRLGSEDSGFWKVLDATDDADASPRFPDIHALSSVGNVDVEGNGEILRIAEVPTQGRRAIRLDRRNLVTDEHFERLPTPFVVQRTGYVPKTVALTFDDGPDETWTPRILDVLKSRHVPATFFIIGENAIEHPLFLRRLIAEGDEIGSHTFTHPNLAKLPDRGIRIELNTTQRVLEAYTGRSVRLFRAPYFGDAEPTTADELLPALQAQRAGYINVGLHVDPNDWQRPGVDAIVRSTVDQVTRGSPANSAQIILLHDGGGDRSQTVAALPRIIDRLRALGYRFVPVSALAGLSRNQVMPPVTGADLLSVRFDVASFLAFAALGYALRWLFFAAIFLGLARALVLAALAVRGSRAHRLPKPPAIVPGRFVSVLIPAFNEARVIEASVRRVLASTDVEVEVIVIDDGSRDDTSAVVRRAFAGEPRVRLLTLENGGKARALNRGLALAGGDIVIALDADTQFEPATIARLGRWFADPAIGAVAGNAKVGNRVNLVTRWQAIEYVTAQNLERRALAQFDAIMVVPGAVGAWRRAALEDVGGYPTDTLAEDQDLTIAIQRRGWRVTYDTDAVAWTEAPESFRALSRQRFRWAYGTLQCLWKHRAVWGRRRPIGLAFAGMPQAWVFQIGFAVISPLIDLALVVSLIATVLRVLQHGWAQTQSDVLRMALYWIAFTVTDIFCGWIAYRLEPREKRYPALLLVAQRIVYRQLMYGVVIRALASALRGPMVGWGKLERSGRVSA